jgi:hypothetical protein
LLSVSEGDIIGERSLKKELDKLKDQTHPYSAVARGRKKVKVFEVNAPQFLKIFSLIEEDIRKMIKTREQMLDLRIGSIKATKNA